MSSQRRRSILDIADFDNFTPRPTESNPVSVETDSDLDKDFSFSFVRKTTVEESHRRQTWLIRNDLIERLERLAAGEPRGFKTKLVNEAIEFVLDQLEGR